jgi:hypothetical protein
MSAHSNMGPSSAHRWMVCAGSVKAEAGLSDTTSEHAAEGTRAHSLAHYLLDPIGASLAEPDDKDMTHHVEAYVDYVQALGGSQKYEVKVDFSEWVPDGWGTADAIVWDGDILHVIDLKYGKGIEVSPIDNEQGMLYALGAYYAFSLIYEIKRIQIHIVQPRLHAFKSWELDDVQLLRFAEQARQCAIDTQADNAPLVPSPKGCQWCKAKATCPALATMAMEVAQLEFGPVLDELQTVPSVESLSTEQQSYIYQHKGMIKSLMDAIEQNLTRELSHGRDVDGYKLVAGRSIRKWGNRDEAEAALRKVSKLKVKDIFDTKLISPTTAEKLLGRGHALLQAHVSRPEGKPTLVTADDTRRAITPLLEEFGEVK